MNYGFVKVAAAVPHVQVADCFYNIQQMEGLMRQASDKGVQIIAFPEMSVTAYTCLDLFVQQTLLKNAEQALLKLVSDTADLNILTIAGTPLVTENRLINAAIAFQSGKILGVVPKKHTYRTTRSSRNNAGSLPPPNYGTRPSQSETEHIRWAATCSSLPDR